MFVLEIVTVERSRVGGRTECQSVLLFSSAWWDRRPLAPSPPGDGSAELRGPGDSLAGGIPDKEQDRQRDPSEHEERERAGDERRDPALGVREPREEPL